MTTQQYCLRWNNHQPNFISVFSNLLNNETLVDVTLSADGRHLQAHKLVLSACSSYFQTLFSINPCQHPIVILKDVKFTDLQVIIDFMYYGEVSVSQEQLPHILKTAEMLKIKGLAEIPVDQSLARQQGAGSSESAELLTTDSNWNVEAKQRQSVSPSALSPTSRRKRLRKSSTGSGSGSTERTSEEQQSSTQSDVTLTSPGLNLATVIKPDPGGFVSDTKNITRIKQHSSDSDLQRGSSHESVDSEPPHQITLQIPQQEMNIQENIPTPQPQIEVPGPSSSTPQPVPDRPIITTHAQLSQSQQTKEIMGTKRVRLLKRQGPVKGDNDPNHGGDIELLTQQQPPSSSSRQLLTVPHLRVERQCSDPLPVMSSPSTGNLLTVPGGNLVKQHSHPLLPSQTHQQHHRQQQNSSPIQISVHFPQQHGQSGDAERAVSPVVGVELVASPPESATPTTLRVRSDELKRSSSSPQTGGTRSSHCPVVRPGPALGCNYCWNTVDTHGRILRRKTKYHCPECQTNLCIVPCFQEYHERNITQADPVALTTSVMRAFPKTSSM